MTGLKVGQTARQTSLEESVSYSAQEEQGQATVFLASGQESAAVQMTINV